MPTSTNIRLANHGDIAALNVLSLDTGLSDGLDDGWVLTPQDDDHTWLVLESDRGVVLGGAYFGPESHSDRVWNLYFLAVSPQHQGGGTGTALMSYIETDLRRRGEGVARVLLIETSGLPNFAPTRDFYRKHGYVQEARIREYYGPGDDKIVFWKSLA